MVIDASVAVKWIVPEPDSDVALRLLGGDHHAPTLLLCEVGNTLWKKERRGELICDEPFDEQMESLSQLVELHPDGDFTVRALQLARKFGHPIYDCIYLAMAERLGTELMTADRRFARKLANSEFGSVVRLL